MGVIELYQKKKTSFLLGVFLVVIVIILVGLIALPSLFYDQWIWKYYWGPVVADAGSGTAWHNGIEAKEGYTLISEITYGIILILAIYGIYKLLKKLQIRVDWHFALALLPYILYGPISRVLEDMDYFLEPVVYWFISPLLYLQIAVYALFFILLGFHLERTLKKRTTTVNTVLFTGGLLFFIPALIVLIIQSLESTTVRFDVFLIVISLVGLITGVVYLIAYRLRTHHTFKGYTNPLNLAMLTGHLIDGITSYISINDPFHMGLHYAEKHPASNFLLDLWGPLFPIVKFLLIIIIIYVFDVLYKDELKDHVTLVNLLKIGILILGFSPGLRDLLRVTIGV
jgi:uncharacterized membrane protein